MTSGDTDSHLQIASAVDKQDVREDREYCLTPSAYLGVSKEGSDRPTAEAVDKERRKEDKRHLGRLSSVVGKGWREDTRRSCRLTASTVGKQCSQEDMRRPHRSVLQLADTACLKKSIAHSDPLAAGREGREIRHRRAADTHWKGDTEHSGR